MNKEQKNQCPRCHQATADDLKAQYTDDDLEVMGTYINAKRNVSEY